MSHDFSLQLAQSAEHSARNSAQTLSIALCGVTISSSATSRDRDHVTYRRCVIDYRVVCRVKLHRQRSSIWHPRRSCCISEACAGDLQEARTGSAFRIINSGAFNDRDLYPFVHTIDGTLHVANGAWPGIRGKNLHDMRDQNGKYTTQDFMRIASTSPYHGWSDFRWRNPKTNTVDEKSAWIERMGEYLIGVGIYKSEQPNQNTVSIISGSPGSDATYLQVAYDLAAVLNDGENLRVLPVVGIGGPQNIRDVRG